MSKRIPDAVTVMLAQINNMSLTEVYHYGGLLRDAVLRRQQAWWGSDEQVAEYAARNVKNTQAAARKAALTARRADWARDNLKPGMVVKMSGTRDSHGVRYVTEVDRGTVLCRQMSPTHRMGRTIEEMQTAYPNKRWVKMAISDEEGKYSIWEVTNTGTDHGVDKVVGVFTEDEQGLLHYKAIK